MPLRVYMVSTFSCHTCSTINTCNPYWQLSKKLSQQHKRCYYTLSQRSTEWLNSDICFLLEPRPLITRLHMSGHVLASQCPQGLQVKNRRTQKVHIWYTPLIHHLQLHMLLLGQEVKGQNLPSSGMKCANTDTGCCTPSLHLLVI